MTRSRLLRFVVAPVVIAALVFGAVSLLSGCSKDSAKKTAQEQADPNRPKAAEPPPPPQLREPKTAVYSYLLWISYAYRTLDSEMASLTVTPFEEVRVDAYVEYNRQQGRAIDQQIADLTLNQLASKGNTATVTAKEKWRYRYINITNGKYNGPWNEISYDTTYTVVKDPAKGWQVTAVEAKPNGVVK